MIALEGHARHRNLCTRWVKDIATYLRGLNNGDESWAKRRMIAARVDFHPNSQDYNEWISQMTSTQKGQAIWDGAGAEITPENLDLTVDFLNANGGAKYDEMANIVYDKRAAKEEF